MSLRPPAPFLKTFCCAPISKGRGWRLSCGSNCELIPLMEDSFPVPAAEKPQAPPPLLTSLSIKKALPLNNKVSSRTGGIAQSYLSLKSVRSGSNFYSKFRLNSITWQGGLGGIFERMFIISIKRVSSSFPESQSYYSTLANDETEFGFVCR